MTGLACRFWGGAAGRGDRGRWGAPSKNPRHFDGDGKNDGDSTVKYPSPPNFWGSDENKLKFGIVEFHNQQPPKSQTSYQRDPKGGFGLFFSILRIS